MEKSGKKEESKKKNQESIKKELITKSMAEDIAKSNKHNKEMKENQRNGDDNYDF